MFELADGFADVVALSVLFKGGYEVGGFFEGCLGDHFEELGGRGGVCGGGMLWREGNDVDVG